MEAGIVANGIETLLGLACLGVFLIVFLAGLFAVPFVVWRMVKGAKRTYEVLTDGRTIEACRKIDRKARCKVQKWLEED